MPAWRSSGWRTASTACSTRRSSRRLTPHDVTGILRLGGTILGTTNRGNPFEYPRREDGKADYSDRVVETFGQMGLDALVVIGGDGTLAIAHQFYLKGIPVVGVPKTIDNDIVGTTSCFGFDTAVSFAADAIDRLHTTAAVAQTDHGRRGDGPLCRLDRAACRDGRRRRRHPHSRDRLRHREGGGAHPASANSWGARFSIVVVAEGAKPVGGAHHREGGGDARRGRAPRRHRRAGRGRAAGDDGEGQPQRRARAPAARRLADRVRSRAGHAFRRQGRGAGAARACSGGWWPTTRPTSCTSRLPMSWAAPRPCRSTTTCSRRRGRSACRSATEAAPAVGRRRYLMVRSTSRYFSAPPVLKSTTLSCGCMRAGGEQHPGWRTERRRLRARRRCPRAGR